MENAPPIDSGRLADKIALITGAASGIGRSTALLFAREGAKVALGDVDVRRAEEVATEIREMHRECMVLSLDVIDETVWASSIETIQSVWGPLDLLVNSAGIADEAPLTELTTARWRRVLSVNLEGTFLGTAAAMRAMQSTGKGAIVNVSSLSGVKAQAGAAAYCVSKAGVIQLSRVAALECANDGHNIRVNCVTPGGVKTPMWEKTPLWPDISKSSEWTAPADAPPLNRFAEPIEVARAILFLASDEASYISGAVLALDGGATA